MNHRSAAPRAVTAALLGAALGLLPGTGHAQQVTRLPDRDVALTGELEDVFCVGEEEGDSWQVFSFIPAVTFDATGNLYILDRDNARVVVLGPDGRFLRSIGKKGEGPGEFGLPMNLTILSDGRLAVFDGASGTVSLFDRSGRYLSFLRPDIPGGRGRADMYAHPRGGLFMIGSNFVISPNGPPQVSDSLPLLRVSDDGKTTTLFKAPTAAPSVNTAGSANRREIRITGAPIFSPQVNWAPLPDGRVAVSWNANYDINLVNANGAVASVLRRPMTARKVTDRDKDAQRKQRREQLASGGGGMRVSNINGRTTTTAGVSLPPEQIEQIIADMQFAETVPVIRRIRTDRDGRIWVERDGGSGSTEYPIDLIGAHGTYIGTLRGQTMPSAFGPGGVAAFIETDDLGVQVVHVRRLPPAWLK
jgi:hypothetical protein